jgi:hypothetical protein
VNTTVHKYIDWAKYLQIIFPHEKKLLFWTERGIIRFLFILKRFTVCFWIFFFLKKITVFSRGDILRFWALETQRSKLETTSHERDYICFSIPDCVKYKNGTMMTRKCFFVFVFSLAISIACHPQSNIVLYRHFV